MTSPAVLPYVAAVQAALANASLAVYLGGAPAGPAPLPKTYCVVYTGPGQVSSASIADDRTTLDMLLQITCVATTPEGSLGTADRARAALAVPLTVDGRATWRPEELGGPHLLRDDDVTPPLYYLPVQYRLRSIPA
ncbi:hypothetical protein P3T27_006497 [Kitasatospora sp. MAA19]|uniref:hypothetical protein n=1 Tax=Kitasatospora sp. MAA19 TaxID=3035090 RepID=UPI002475A764|nr:hypothetical protein [Kitasatospora sp. MAA19]MDH6709748.1 hypothetical protein [Kitasatospora sp. MAA19]